MRRNTQGVRASSKPKQKGIQPSPQDVTSGSNSPKNIEQHPTQKGNQSLLQDGNSGLNSPINIVQQPKMGEHIHDNILPPNGAISLADIMSRLDNLSHVPQKIDNMAQDLKQLTVIKDAMAQIQTDVCHLQGSVTHIQEVHAKSQQDLAEVQAEVQHLSSTVADLKEARIQNEQNQQALAKELLALRARIQKQDTLLKSPGNSINHNTGTTPSVNDFERLKIEAELRKQNLILEGVREDRCEREGASEEQAYYFI